MYIYCYMNWYTYIYMPTSASVTTHLVARLLLNHNISLHVFINPFVTAFLPVGIDAISISLFLKEEQGFVFRCAILHICMPACIYACLPAYMQACLHVCMPTRMA